MNLTQVSNRKKKFYKRYEQNFEKSKNPIWSKTAQLILMPKIYVIEGTKEVMRKIQEPIPLIRREQKNYWIFLTIF